MRFLFTSAWKDALRILRDPAGLIAWLVMPILLNGIISLVFRNDPMPQGKLLLVDEDQSLVSGLIAGAFSREPLSKMVLLERVDAATGRTRIDAGDASAILTVPKGFGTAVLQRKRSTLQLVKNPSARIVPEIIEQSLTLVLEGTFYVQKVLGPQFDRFTGAGSPSDVDVASASVALNRLIPRLSKYLNPPLLDIETTQLAQRKQTPFPVLFFPGMLMLAIFGMALSRSEDLWRERAQGTLRRALTTPHGMAAFFGGKVIAHAAVFACIGALLLLLARVGLNAEIQLAAISIVWIACSGVALYLITVMIQLAASDQRAGVMLSAFVLFLFAMLGGMFFPFEMMPAWLAAIGRYVPNGWMIARFKEIIAGQTSAAVLLQHFATLTLPAVVAFLFISHRLRKWSLG